MSETDRTPEIDPVAQAVPTDGAADQPEIRRRLADAAATTTVDEERAWAEIQARISSVRPAGGDRRVLDLGRVPRRVVAAAAVVILVVGALLWFGEDDDGGRVVTDDSTTTTDGGTTSTTDDGASGTSTTVRAGETPEDPGAGGPRDGQPAPGSGGAGPGSGSDTGSGGGGGSGTASPPGTSTATTSPPADTAGDGRRPAVTLSTAAYTAWGTAWADGGGYGMNVWAPQLDTYLNGWSWTGSPGGNCLEVSSSSLTGSDGQSHTLVWGLVRADATAVRIVTTGGVSSSAALGSEVAPGLRPWIGESPRGQVDRAEALDGSGGVLHTSSSPSWSTTPATC
jgi:hypothetical protein